MIIKSIVAALLLAAAPAASASAEVEPSRVISVDFDGSLKDALREIGERGGLNLIVTGELSAPAQVHLQGVSAFDALAAVAESHGLVVTRRGSVVTVRPRSAAEAVGGSLGGSLGGSPGGSVNGSVKSAPVPGSAAAVAAAPPLTAEDVSRAAGSLTVAQGETVKDAVAYGGAVMVNGHVLGNAIAYGDSVTLGPTAIVEKDVMAFGGDVIRAPGAQVRGKVVTFGGTSSGTAIRLFKGNLEEHTQQVEATSVREEREIGGLPGFFLRFALMFGLGFLLVMLAPQRMKNLESEIARAPWRSGFLGVALVVLLVPVTAALILSVIGIPIAVAMWVLAVIGVTMGVSALAADVGMKLPFFRRQKTQALVLAMGLLLLLGVSYIPFLGPLAVFLAGSLALGAAVRTRLGAPPKGLPERIA